MKQNVNVDLMCSVLDIPCNNDASLSFLFSFSRRPRGVCTRGRATNVRIALRTRTSSYSVDLGFDNSGR